MTPATRNDLLRAELACARGRAAVAEARLRAVREALANLLDVRVYRADCAECPTKRNHVDADDWRDAHTAARGLTSTNDAGEDLLAAVEVAAGLTLPGVDARSPAMVLATLESLRGNVSATARTLGMARTTVREKARRARAVVAIPTCPACEERPGVLDGYCAECDRDLRAEADARRAGDEWMPR